MKKKISNKKLVEYYKLFWQLAKLHGPEGLNFGETPRTSEKFTEYLCAEIFDLEKSGCPAYDLKTKEKRNFQKIEIKGTTSSQGKTTINRKLPFDWLYWVDMRNKNIILIYKIHKNDLNKYSKGKGERTSICLGSKKIPKGKPDKFKIESDTFSYFNETTTDK